MKRNHFCRWMKYPKIPRLRFRSFLQILVTYAVTTILGITILANVQYEVSISLMHFTAIEM